MIAGDEPLRPPGDDTLIRGARVRLREKRLADAANDYAWRSDPELARYDAAQPLRIDFRDFLLIYGEDLLHPSPLRHSYGIEDEHGRHIGNVMYYNVDHRRKQAELGITIGARDCWSRGYGSDAVRALLRHVFAATDLTRIVLNTLRWNERAQAAFAKAGFRATGRDRRDGFDFVVMEALRDEFLAADAARKGGADGERPA